MDGETKVSLTVVNYVVFTDAAILIANQKFHPLVLIESDQPCIKSWFSLQDFNFNHEGNQKFDSILSKIAANIETFLNGELLLPDPEVNIIFLGQNMDEWRTKIFKL